MQALPKTFNIFTKEILTSTQPQHIADLYIERHQKLGEVGSRKFSTDHDGRIIKYVLFENIKAQQKLTNNLAN